MPMRVRKNGINAAVLAITGAALLLPTGEGSAQSPPASSSATAQASAAQPDYHPSMGDLMTMAVQPRHTKLGLAGRQRNWTYAEYELSELRNAFGRIAKTIPIYRTADMAALIGGMTTEPLDALEQAVRAGDSSRFMAAYGRLTVACNACHVSQGHAMVVIEAPDGAAYPDQDFRPPRH